MHKIYGGLVLALAGLLIAYRMWPGGGLEVAVPPRDTPPRDAGAEAWNAPPSGPEASALRREAQNYIEEISGTSGEEPVSVAQADDFVTPDREIRLGDAVRHEALSGKELQELERNGPDATLRVLRRREEVEYKSLAELLANHEGELDTPLQVMEDNRVEQVTLGRLLDEKAGRLQELVPIIVLREYEEVSTVREEARRLGGDPERSVQVVRSPDRPESTTVRELLTGLEAVDENAVFFVRHVTADDHQGIWGILHRGIIEKFATGIAVRRNEDIERYQVRIPRDADERRQDESSSFLGRLLDDKARESFVYNYEEGRMGRNPNLIFPGQELVIVSFNTEELISIYQHFVERGLATETEYDWAAQVEPPTS